MSKFWRQLTVAMGITAILLVLLSFGMKAMHQNNREKPVKIMIKQSAWTRLTSQPCKPGTKEYMSDYIICERRDPNARPTRSSDRGDRAGRSRGVQSLGSPRAEKSKAARRQCKQNRWTLGCEIEFLRV